MDSEVERESFIHLCSFFPPTFSRQILAKHVMKNGKGKQCFELLSRDWAGHPRIFPVSVPKSLCFAIRQEWMRIFCLHSVSSIPLVWRTQCPRSTSAPSWPLRRKLAQLEQAFAHEGNIIPVLQTIRAWTSSFPLASTKNNILAFLLRGCGDDSVLHVSG